jgi:hypothetical protein
MFNILAKKETMSYLQLAENDPNLTHLAETVMMNKDKYLFIPAGFRGAESDLYVREDLLDNLPDPVYDNLMFELAPFQPAGLSSKRDDRRARRAERKKTKGGAARREARQKRIETRAAARAQGGGFLDKVAGIATNIFGQKAAPAELDVNVGGGGVDVSYGPEEEPTFLQKYKVPLIIGGVVLIGGGIYLATRKKK